MLRWANKIKGAAAVALLCLVPLTGLAGDPAQDFTLRDLDGRTVRLADYRGQVVVLSFWATWCGPCKEEMPHLQRMHAEKKDQGLTILSITTDDARTKSQVKPFIKKNQYAFTVLYDTDSAVIASYNPAKTLPFTVVVDRAHTVAKLHSGYQPGDEKALEALVDELLAQTP